MTVALVIGGSGLVGAHLTRELLDAGWDVITTQRKPPRQPPEGVRVLPLDLLDEAGVASSLAGLQGVTHVFYLARAWRPGYLIDLDDNVAALRRVLDAIQDWPTLEHVQLVHGLKWYGSTHGPFPTPARETDPTPPGPHFYYRQRALIEERQRGRGWHWTTLRPHCVSGVTRGSPSNLMLGIGAWAALQAQWCGTPVPFPATQQAFEARLTYTSADLLARAMRWSAQAEAARNQDFNIANGDTFRWADVWPGVCGLFGGQPGPASPRRLHEEASRWAPAWRGLCGRKHLADTDFERLVDWHFMDASLALQWDQVMSTDRIRAAGFAETVDTPQMIQQILRTYRSRSILPA
ncbi:NAD-dependent epimerase/dehydratase family protein [Pseudorhodoferax sp.]|uniref:NAD-dependent epimerase/dehydratase family protein n=1 Tax=Pseudorhodoferax sp. TaxID=1993553 RepID=UPI002DD6A392|nr:NAD-dependent epimerase/dehydratase family protein [Pseudorhodoferax sp.]